MVNHGATTMQTQTTPKTKQQRRYELDTQAARLYQNRRDIDHKLDALKLARQTREVWE